MVDNSTEIVPLYKVGYSVQQPRGVGTQRPGKPYPEYQKFYKKIIPFINQLQCGSKLSAMATRMHVVLFFKHCNKS